MNKEERNKYQAKYQSKRRIEYRKRILEEKIHRGKCELCGWNIHLEILEFNHIDKSTKRFDMSVGPLGCYSWDTIKAELDKCQLICPNCHRWIHYQEKDWFTGRGYEPHNKT